ncbi:hypothetical protein ASD79_08060 [Caulobacter sp. Root655]|uniref:hypothetical protein n=1 Tax=Caulobacter sp. Root655 TaxID=1736578 RepID=UPI0006F789C7|nr:hypothetical protein [Caulobacter sp. Root655]KRA60181.1 hypothetical protein ASD79_08060 [Caulobacter sp. Root655]
MARTRPHDHQPRPSVADPRSILLAAALDFVREARTCPNVLRIALVGSLSTAKPIPKDVDVLVTLTDHDDLAALAQVARRLRGRANAINLGADIFLCDAEGRYLGRVCRYRECHPRMACDGLRCATGGRLNDDLHLVTLDRALTLAPPIDLWPRVERRVAVPDDVERLLLSALEQDLVAISADRPGAG